ncbi:hypothetical protein HHK36_027770 [Tetracentron sinense]|uniref:MBD domain-containing protein n=1 Tax=Tetracentron sinense TaxID=13715 RepID=A0A834YDN0_TETSI|nr:hypothetical protein HHK36_027770 [Tetracentron sinense]
MADEESPDWLPPGWDMVVEKGRKNGHKDMVVVEKATADGLPSDWIKEVKVRKGTSKVVVEKATADGLPPGWIKEIKVRKGTRKTRRDPYYTDPVTGYVFRSEKDVLRYLQTGDLGRLAIKPKQSNNDLELLNDNISTSPIHKTFGFSVKTLVRENNRKKGEFVDSPSAAKRPRLASIATRRQLFTGQTSKLNETVEDEQILESSVTEGCVPLSKRASDQCGESTDLSGLALPEATGSKKRQVKKDCDENMFDSAPAAEILPEKQALVNGVEKQKNRETRLSSSKSKDKKELILPRRASKRLAGIKADQAPDLETSKRVRRDTAKQSDGSGTSNRAHSVATRQSGELEEHPEEIKTEKKDDEKAEWNDTAKQSDGSGTSNRAHSVAARQSGELEEHPEEIKTEKKDDEKAEWNDTAKQSDGSGTSNRARSVAARQSGDLEEHLEEIKTEKKDDENAEFPFGDSWPDPCLEFAFKTLTGAIPVEDNKAIQDYFQQLSTSQTQTDNGLALLDIGLDSSCQTELLDQFEALKQPVLGQQFPVKPTFPSPGYIGLTNSSENAQQPSGEGNKECLTKVNQ